MDGKALMWLMAVLAAVVSALVAWRVLAAEGGPRLRSVA